MSAVAHMPSGDEADSGGGEKINKNRGGSASGDRLFLLILRGTRASFYLRSIILK